MVSFTFITIKNIISGAAAILHFVLAGGVIYQRRKQDGAAVESRCRRNKPVFGPAGGPGLAGWSGKNINNSVLNLDE